MSPSAPQLKRTLGFWQVALYGTGSMLGAGIYALIGKAAGSLGNAMWLAFLAAMAGAMLTGLSYAAVGSRFPKAGGAAYATHRAFGLDWLSYLIGIAVMMSGLTSMATGSQAIIGQFQKAWPGVSWLVAAGAVKPLAIVVVLLIGLVIYRGIRESMLLNILCTVIEAAGLLFIIAIGIKYWGSVNYLEMPKNLSTASGSVILMAILQGAVLTFYSFIGFEDILNVSEEVKDPERNVPKGLITAMLISTGIYMAVAITAVSVVPYAELGTSGAPLMDVAKRAAPWFTNIDSLYVGIAIFAIANTALLNYLMGSRLLYGMSSQGLLPAILSRLHPTRHTPHIAVAVLFVIVSTLILSADVKQMAEATVLLLLVVFTTVNIALVVIKRRETERSAGFDVPTFVPILGALVCSILIVVRIIGAVQSTDPANQRAPLVAGTIVALALLLYKVVKPKNVLLEDGD
jgi:amino acid transporter